MAKTAGWSEASGASVDSEITAAAFMAVGVAAVTGSRQSLDAFSA
jgi:hypothetical protein